MLAARYEHNVDAQNRVTIPSRLRDGIEKNIRIMPTPDEIPCLYVYSEAEFNKVEAALHAKAVTSEARSAVRRLLGDVVYGEIDKAGRITLTQELVDYSGITGKVMIVKNANHVEIWSIDNWLIESSAEVDNSVLNGVVF